MPTRVPPPRLSPSLIPLLLLALAGVCGASTGDRSPQFRLCLETCARSKCSRPSGESLPVSLALLGWSCEEDCAYGCMHQVTKEDITHNRPVQQFYGKWPFIRVLGVQEPASVVFSIMNGATVLIGYTHFSTSAPHDYHLHGALFMQLLVSMNTWLWSTVFHTRDVGWTEKLDYFSAALLIVCGLVVQFIRLSGEGALLWQYLYGGLWLFLYLLHIAYLSLAKRFDYGYNMTACVAAGSLYAAIWTTWSISVWKQRRYVWKCVAAVVLGSCTVLLELLDFPPLFWAVDAHALWHLSTVPLPFLWYSFLIDDANYESRETKKKQV